MQLNIARTVPRSEANGPGQRFVIWVQGCPLRCPGCWNPDTWSFAVRELRDAVELAEEILATKPLEGVTFTGGEPFHQARALAEIACRVQSAGLSVFVFSGYELRELTRPDHRELLSLTDVLVSGRYMQSRRSLDTQWRGSTNQEVHFLSSRYDEGSMRDTGQMEFHLGPDGRVAVTGFPLPQFSEWDAAGGMSSESPGCRHQCVRRCDGCAVS